MYTVKIYSNDILMVTITRPTYADVMMRVCDWMDDLGLDEIDLDLDLTSS